MLAKIRSALRHRFAQKPEENVEVDADVVRQSILLARKVQGELVKFINEDSRERLYVSLGQNCSTAWYLKQVGVKLNSYPFDWIFTSCAIVEDCIENRFANYQDQSQIFENSDGSAGHRLYHAKMFNHRSPLNSEISRSYYQRCCDRFLDILSSDSPCVFVITLVNEIKKRPDWAGGFTSSFPLPENQGIASVASLFDALKTRNSNSRLIVIEQYSHSNNEIEFKRIDKDIFHIKYFANEGASGTRYNSDLDDFCFRLIMSSLA